MTPERLQDCLALVRWSRRGLADALGCDESLVRQWSSGEVSIPCGVAAWMETLAQVHEAAPPPKTWRKRRAILRVAA